MSKLTFTATERKALNNFAKDCYGDKFIQDGEVQPMQNSQELDEFVRDFLKSRGVGQVTKEIGLWRFSHVNMHTDVIHPPNYWTLMIPVKGNGELAYHLDKDKLNYHQFHGKSRFAKAAIFNDHLPHAFISKSKVCYAILVDIRSIEAKKLLE